MDLGASEVGSSMVGASLDGSPGRGGTAELTGNLTPIGPVHRRPYGCFRHLEVGVAFRWRLLQALGATSSVAGGSQWLLYRDTGRRFGRRGGH
jgi:hypothetical protein